MMENEMERHEVPEADRVVENVPENTGRAMLTFICVLAAFLLLLVSIGRWFPLRETKQGTLTYDVYSGPVMPLTVQGDAAGITASREINFDLSAYAGTAQEFLMLDPSADVTDAYTLTNASLEDRTLTLLYPVIGSIFDCPEVTVDGADAALTLHAGPYSGHFDDAISGGLNLVEARCFADYQDLLADGSYMNAALADFPERDAPVTVYRLHDYVYSRATDAANPTLSMDFRIDPQKTCVFTYGSNGGSRDPATGCCSVRKGGIEYRAYLEEENILHHVEGRYHWSAEDFPASEISLRSAASENFVIIDITNPAHHNVIGEMDRFTVPMLLHENAIYMHEAQQYQVEKLDFDACKAFIRQVDVGYYTDADLNISLSLLESWYENTNERSALLANDLW